jgi:hypothetical protein
MPNHSHNANIWTKPFRLRAERADAFDRGGRPTAMVWLIFVFGLYLFYTAYMRTAEEAADQVSGGDVPSSTVTAAGPTGCLLLLLSGPLSDAVDARPRRNGCDTP